MPFIFLTGHAPASALAAWLSIEVAESKGMRARIMACLGARAALGCAQNCFAGTKTMQRRLLLSAFAATLAGPALAQGLTEAQRAEILGILRDALKRDPSLLRDGLAALQAAEDQERFSAQSEAIRAHEAALLRNPADPVRGNPRGDVTIVEFFDARCPFCKRLAGEMKELLRQDRNIRLVMKDLPVLGPASVNAARALLAAQRQGKYGEFYDALMALRGEPTDAVLRAEAERVGLDVPRWQRDLLDPTLQQRIDANLQLARALRIEGTPALIIGDAFIPGAVPLADLESAVAEVRRARR
jgi:protein-disulfide isomerase